MDNKQLWMLVYAQVLSIRFHPANKPESIKAEILFADEVATAAVQHVEESCLFG